VIDQRQSVDDPSLADRLTPTAGGEATATGRPTATESAARTAPLIARPDGKLDTGQPSRLGRWARVGLWLSFALIVAPYLIALGSPLRLFDDGVTYLSLADGVPTGPHQGYPPGYPALLRLAEHLGLGSAWGFVAVNLVILGIGIVCVYRMCRRPLGLTPVTSSLVCLAVLLSHTVSELAPVLMSDTAYLGVALLCVLTLSNAETRSGRARRGLLLGALALTALAVSIRIAGLALIPPLAFVAVGKPRLLGIWRAVRRRRLTLPALIASLLLLTTLTVLIINATPYAPHVAQTYRTTGGTHAFLGRMGTDARAKLASLGEVAAQTNCCVRAGRLIGVQNLAVVSDLFAAAGVAFIALAAFGWMAHRRFGAIEMFVLSTAAVIVVYAGGISRFWIAALPLLFAYAARGFQRLARFRISRLAAVVYLIGFAVAGGGWLAQSVRLSLAGRDFPRVAATSMFPQLAASYRVAFGEAVRGDRNEAMPAAVTLLRRYEPLARAPHGSGPPGQSLQP
jgi:hypothetical protein